MGALIPILLGGLALYAVSRKKITGIGAVDGYVITMKVQRGEYHGVPMYYKYVFCGWDRKGYAIWESTSSYRAYDEKLYKTLSAAEKAVARIISDGDVREENVRIVPFAKYAGASGIGKLTDAPLDLNNILMGVSRGWYTARAEELAGWGYVVWLTGKKADGEPVEDVYPISKQTYEALKAQGVDAAKRRIYHELATAQKRGIDFNRSYSENNDSDLEQLATKYGYKNNPNSPRSYGEQYFNNLKRAYNAIAATDLPFNESVVYNDHGDEIMRYRDYGTDEQRLQNAIDDLADDYSESGIYWRIIGMIANGQVKLLWTVPGYDKLKGYKGLQDELYGRQAPEERKLYKAVLATAANGGITPAKFVHQIWESLPPESRLDDMQIRNIVLDALRDVQTPKQARAAILSNYYDTHTLPEQPDIEYFADDPEQQRMFEEFTGDDEIPF